MWINTEENLPGGSAAWGWLFRRQGFENYLILHVPWVSFGGKRTKIRFYPLPILTHLTDVWILSEPEAEVLCEVCWMGLCSCQGWWGLLLPWRCSLCMSFPPSRAFPALRMSDCNKTAVLHKCSAPKNYHLIVVVRPFFLSGLGVGEYLPSLSYSPSVLV